RYAIARQQELTAERDYRRGKRALGRNRQERHERRRRSVARWTGMIGRVAPNDIRLDRMPEGNQDPRWLRVMGRLAKAHNAQKAAEAELTAAKKAHEPQPTQSASEAVWKRPVLPEVSAELPKKKTWKREVRSVRRHSLKQRIELQSIDDDMEKGEEW
ncbi:MAG: hypothetical protein ABJO81_04665, partial [Hyphomicrobiales bacterium]